MTALLSPVDRLAYELFMFHMVQHLLLTLIGAPLILLGSPMIPILRGIPRTIRVNFVNPSLRHVAIRNFLKFLSLPMVAWAIYVTSILGWHSPPAYNLALTNEIVHDFEHLTFTLSGILFWWNIIDPIPLRSNLSYLGRVPYIFLTTIPNFVLGGFLTFASSPLYAHYANRNLPFGLTAVEDQQIAGTLMWIPGAIILLITLLSMLFLAISAEEKNQRQKERLYSRIEDKTD
jgi:putative membrane protein